MIKTRYDFFKRSHGEYVVVFIKKSKYVVFGEDKKLLEFLGGRNIVAVLEEEFINYIIVDELEIIKEKVFDGNRYEVFKKKLAICDVLVTYFKLFL